ncbi:MAG: hypothetical protein ABSD70_17030 [Terracidiphilus sp.]
MRNTVKLQALAALVVFALGWFLAGCKPAPELTSDQAKTLIQAKYDQDPGLAFNVSVDDRGMQQGVAAKYWAGTKRFPNGYWGDFKLTDDGKKVVKLPGGGDVIQWRPEGPADPHYVVVVVPLALSHLKTRSVGDVETIADTRTVSFMEDVDLTGLPQPLQNIAHNPVNKLSTQRLATFVLTNGAWTLKSIV